MYQMYQKNPWCDTVYSYMNCIPQEANCIRTTLIWYNSDTVYTLIEEAAAGVGIQLRCPHCPRHILPHLSFMTVKMMIVMK